MFLQSQQAERLLELVALCQSSFARMLSSIRCQPSCRCQPESGVVAYVYANDKCIIMGVVKTSNIFFRESNDKVVDLRHLRYGTCQLDIVNHPEVSFTSPPRQPGGRCTPHNHSYIPYRQSRTLVFPSEACSWGGSALSLLINLYSFPCLIRASICYFKS